MERRELRAETEVARGERMLEPVEHAREDQVVGEPVARGERALELLEEALELGERRTQLGTVGRRDEPRESRERESPGEEPGDEHAVGAPALYVGGEPERVNVVPDRLRDVRPGRVLVAGDQEELPELLEPREETPRQLPGDAPVALVAGVDAEEPVDRGLLLLDQALADLEPEDVLEVLPLRAERRLLDLLERDGLLSTGDGLGAGEGGEGDLFLHPLVPPEVVDERDILARRVPRLERGRVREARERRLGGSLGCARDHAAAELLAGVEREALAVLAVEEQGDSEPEDEEPDPDRDLAPAEERDEGASGRQGRSLGESVADDLRVVVEAPALEERRETEEQDEDARSARLVARRRPDEGPPVRRGGEVVHREQHAVVLHVRRQGREERRREECHEERAQDSSPGRPRERDREPGEGEREEREDLEREAVSRRRRARRVEHEPDERLAAHRGRGRPEPGERDDEREPRRPLSRREDEREPGERDRDECEEELAPREPVGVVDRSERDARGPAPQEAGPRRGRARERGSLPRGREGVSVEPAPGNDDED